MEYKEIPAFVINLQRRADRLQTVTREFIRIGWNFTCIYAYDPDEEGITNEDLGQFRDKGAIGCYESHRFIWRENRDQDIIAVFEDDVVFSKLFQYQFSAIINQIPSDWIFLNLSSFGNDPRSSDRYISEDLVAMGDRFWGTHGYILKKPAIEILLSFDDRYAVDYYIYDKLFDAGVNLYACKRESTLCYQSGSISDIKGGAATHYWRKVLHEAKINKLVQTNVEISQKQ